MKIRFHYFIVVALRKTWPKLFERYYSEYEEVIFNYGQEYFEEEK